MMITDYWQWFCQSLYMESITHSSYFNYDAQTSFTGDHEGLSFRALLRPVQLGSGGVGPSSWTLTSTFY